MFRHCCLHRLILSHNLTPGSNLSLFTFLETRHSIQYCYYAIIVTSFLFAVQVVDVNASPGGGPKGKATELCVFFFFTESHGKPDHNFICNRRYLYIKVGPSLCPYLASFTLIMSRLSFQGLAVFSAMNENIRSQSPHRQLISIVSAAK